VLRKQAIRFYHEITMMQGNLRQKIHRMFQNLTLIYVTWSVSWFRKQTNRTEVRITERVFVEVIVRSYHGHLSHVCFY